MIKRFNLLILSLLAVNNYVFAAQTTCPLSESEIAPNSHLSSKLFNDNCFYMKDESAKHTNVHNISLNKTKVMFNDKDALINEQSANRYEFTQSLNVHKDVQNNQDFIYEIDSTKNPSGEVIILLHGSGGNEKSLMPFARSIWTNATLVGIRGRVVQKGEQRWYKKISATRFDQKDVKQESQAFTRFLTEIATKHKLDTSRFIFIGYSNGANLLAVVLMQQPDLVQRAILLRSMPVLDKMPRANLGNTNVLTLYGQKDQLYSPFAPKLLALLKNNGANVESHMVASDHMIGDLDKELIVSWLDNRNSHN